MVEEIIKKLEASGQFKFDYFPGEALMSGRNAFDGIRQGALEIAVSAASYQIDVMGIVGEVQYMPGLFDFEKFVAHYRDPGGFYDFEQPYFQKVGLRLLSDQHTPPNILCSTKPIYTLEDMKGLLFRDPGGCADWERLLGATPVAIASTEVYEALMRRQIEATPPSLSSYVSNKWYEVAPYVNAFEFLLGGMHLIMKNDIYNSLPADARKLFDKTVLDAEVAMFDLARKQEADNFALVQTKGAKVYNPPATEMARWQAAIQPYYDGLAKKYGAEWTAFMKIRATLLK